MTTPQDTDIREALRRKYADKPQLPSDFMQRMHDKMDKEKRTSRQKPWKRQRTFCALKGRSLT